MNNNKILILIDKNLLQSKSSFTLCKYLCSSNGWCSFQLNIIKYRKHCRTDQKLMHYFYNKLLSNICQSICLVGHNFVHVYALFEQIAAHVSNLDQL